MGFERLKLSLLYLEYITHRQVPLYILIVQGNC